jgi:hypothetical protein
VTFPPLSFWFVWCGGGKLDDFSGLQRNQHPRREVGKLGKEVELVED